MNTPNICRKPWVAGWSVDAAAAAFGADPMPASLENKPRRTPMVMPCAMVYPAKPAAAGPNPNAL